MDSFLWVSYTHVCIKGYPQVNRSIGGVGLFGFVLQNCCMMLHDNSQKHSLFRGGSQDPHWPSVVEKSLLQRYTKSSLESFRLETGRGFVVKRHGRRVRNEPSSRLATKNAVDEMSRE